MPLITLFKRLRLWVWDLPELHSEIRLKTKQNRTKQSKTRQDRTWSALNRLQQETHKCEANAVCSLSPRWSWHTDKTLSGERYMSQAAPLPCGTLQQTLQYVKHPVLSSMVLATEGQRAFVLTCWSSFQQSHPSGSSHVRNLNIRNHRTGYRTAPIT